MSTIRRPVNEYHTSYPATYRGAYKSITAQDRANPEPVLKKIVGSILEQFPSGA